MGGQKRKKEKKERENIHANVMVPFSLFSVLEDFCNNFFLGGVGGGDLFRTAPMAYGASQA